MLYRIDMDHFLLDAIDYFTREELIHANYVIFSAKIGNNGREGSRVTKLNSLYPTPEIITAYAESKDKDHLKRMYADLVKVDGPKDYWVSNLFYKSFINPLLHHEDVVIVCDKKENDLVDVLCDYLKEHFGAEVLDLNQLFSKGKVGSLYLDRKKVWDKAVDIRRQAGYTEIESLSTSSEGRLHVLHMYNKKEKIAKLKELGISVHKNDMKDLDQLLMDAWVNNPDFDKKDGY